MEALFSTTLASYEAWLMVLCVIVFFGIYLFDGISFVQRVYAALKPAKPQWAIAPLTWDEIVPEVTSPILEPIAPEEVEAHEAEKAKAEEKHEQEVIESEVFEEKILEELQQAEELEKSESIESTENETDIKMEPTEVTEENKEWEEESTLSSESIEESWDIVQEIDTTESEEVIENDLEEKEKIEEELLDVAEVGETTQIDTTQETKVETKIESTEDTEVAAITEVESPEEKTEEEAIIEEGTIEIESELQEESQEVEITETLEETEEDVPSMVTEDAPIVSSETIVESGDLIEQIADEWKVTEAKEETTIEDTPLATEDAHAIPITASIPEPKPEPRKSVESQNTEKLYTIVSEVKTLLARGSTQEARALIIQGLALDKNHRELNLILGSIYESERQAQKAEYIYKDLALIYPEDGEILERLANILIIEKRYDLALEIYKKIISLSGETEWSLYIMTHLAHELGHNEELYAYARRYQKNWPNNPDILTLLAQAEIALGERQAAIQTLIKLKNLTPYNNEIMETIAKLTMEEELAGNFGGEKI